MDFKKYWAFKHMGFTLNVEKQSNLLKSLIIDKIYHYKDVTSTHYNKYYDKKNNLLDMKKGYLKL